MLAILPALDGKGRKCIIDPVPVSQLGCPINTGRKLIFGLGELTVFDELAGTVLVNPFLLFPRLALPAPFFLPVFHPLKKCYSQS